MVNKKSQKVQKKNGNRVSSLILRPFLTLTLIRNKKTFSEQLIYNFPKKITNLHKSPEKQMVPLHNQTDNHQNNIPHNHPF